MALPSNSFKKWPLDKLNYLSYFRHGPYLYQVYLLTFRCNTYAKYMYLYIIKNFFTFNPTFFSFPGVMW